MIIIDSLYRYPIKSLAGEPLSQVQLTGQGIIGDREWALVSPDQSALWDSPLTEGSWVPCSTFERLTIRPEMATWRATSTDTGVQLLIDNELISLKQGDEAIIEERNVSLARANNGYWDHADATISIINLNTIDAISEAMGVSVDPARFRANIYIRATAWSEFEWLGHNLQFGEATLSIIRPIDRCKATSVAPNVGEITYNMPAQLARHFGHIYCGVYARVIKEGQVQINATGSMVESKDNNSYIHVDYEAIKNSTMQATAPKLSNWPRSAQVVKLVEETTGIRSIWLRDSLASVGAWDTFKSGQHVRFHGLEEKGTWRTYTVSGYDNGLFRVTVKRDMTIGAGIGSGKMHDLQVGDSVTITGPEGNLTIPHQAKSLHIITAGIGITPAVAMLAELQHYKQPVRFTHTARSDQIALWHEIENFAATRPNIQAELFISDADSDSTSAHKNSHYLSQSGRPDLEVVARLVHDDDANVIICGPANFTTEILAALAKENISDERISFETFASVAIAADLAEPPSAGPFAVRFSDSGIDAIWHKEDGTLLDLAERHGLVPAAHCRAGICGTCSVNLSSKGQIAQLAGIACQKDKVLLCCSVPTGDIELLM